MAKKEHIVRASADQIRQMVAQGGDKTDWTAARAMTQAEVERLADEDEGTLPEGWESTVEIGVPVRKQAVNMRLDADVLAWFRAHGPGYQTRINSVLRAFVQTRQRTEMRESSPKPG
jgi:uncharacterized protein (DUF4415 family)